MIMIKPPAAGRVHTVRGGGCDWGRGLLSSRLVRGLLLVTILGGAVGVAGYLLSG